MKQFFLSLMLIVCCNLMSLAAIDYTQIYLIGGAAPNGWDNNKAEKMELVPGSDAVFTWTGVLKSGDFKFLNALGSWDNCFHTSTANVEILDYNGRIIASKTITTGTIASNLPCGLYIAKATISNSKAVKKLIVK